MWLSNEALKEINRLPYGYKILGTTKVKNMDGDEVGCLIVQYPDKPMPDMREPIMFVSHFDRVTGEYVGEVLTLPKSSLSKKLTEMALSDFVPNQVDHNNLKSR